MLAIELSELPRVSRMDEYFGLWAMMEATFLAAFERVSHMDLRLHVEQAKQPRVQSTMLKAAAAKTAASAEPQPYIAVLSVTGSLMKQVGSLEDGSSTVQLRRDVRKAAADPLCTAIMLLIDSPGGTVAGTSDLAADVSAAGKKKPVYGFVEDLCASAAYWVGSCCEKLYANSPTCVVGSIGTYAGLYDLSGMAGQQGVKVKLYKTGPLKGAGFPGTEITAEQDAAFQRLVDQTQAHFAAAVKANRSLSDKQLQAVSTGGVWLAAEAQSLGLIDGVQTFDQALAELEARSKGGSAGGGGKRTMAEALEIPSQENGPGVLPAADTQSGATAGDNKEDAAMAPQSDSPSANAGAKAASLKEIRAALPKANNDFLVKCIEDGLTLEQAKDAFITQQAEELDKLRARAGTQPLGAGNGKPSAAGAEDFNELVAAAMEANPKLERREAIKQVARQNPEAHKAYVAGSPRAADMFPVRTRG